MVRKDLLYNLGKRSDRLIVLNNICSQKCEKRPDTEIRIINGDVLVNFFRSLGCKTFRSVRTPEENEIWGKIMDIACDYNGQQYKGTDQKMCATGPSQRRPAWLNSPISRLFQFHHEKASCRDTVFSAV